MIVIRGTMLVTSSEVTFVPDENEASNFNELFEAMTRTDTYHVDVDLGDRLRHLVFPFVKGVGAEHERTPMSDPG